MYYFENRNINITIINDKVSYILFYLIFWFILCHEKLKDKKIELFKTKLNVFGLHTIIIRIKRKKKEKKRFYEMKKIYIILNVIIYN
jgi:hypothetical protein